MEGYEITVQLFPPAGLGIQMVHTPQGAIQQLVPAVEYPRVKDLSVIAGEHGVSLVFTTRTGEQIQTNLPYIIKQTPLPQQD